MAVESSLEIVAGWVGSLQGDGNFIEVLERLTSLIKADAAILLRVEKNQKAARIIALTDRNAGKLFSARNRPSFSTAVLGDDIEIARPGTLWQLSDGFGDPELAKFHDSKELQEFSIRDVAVIVQEKGFRASYFLEFHFSTPLLEHNRLILLTLANTLSNIWRDRRPGVAQAMESKTRLRSVTGPVRQRVGNIMTAANPLGLSRSEYRVCMMIRQGYLAKRIAQELVVQECTVRTHLRSIYGKAGVSGHVELLHRLAVGSDRRAGYGT